MTQSSNFEYNLVFPTALNIAAKTISADLLGASEDEVNKVKNKVKSENREGKITSIIEGTNYTEKKLEDDKDYQELMSKGVAPMSKPSSQLHYIDYIYGKSSTHKKTRRAGKKHKKK